MDVALPMEPVRERLVQNKTAPEGGAVVQAMGRAVGAAMFRYQAMKPRRAAATAPVWPGMVLDKR
jgi:hypothetical protein